MKFPAAQQQYRLFAKEIQTLPNKSYSILEVGAGERIIKNQLPKNFKYKSLDMGKDQDYNLNLDEKKFPIKSSTFDIIICLETLEHVMYPEKVMKEMIRVAKKDAVFFLSMPNEYNFLQRAYYLLGKKTMYDEPFKVVEKHLHIHKPRVKDIISLFSRYLTIEKIDYVWESRHST